MGDRTNANDSLSSPKGRRKFIIVCNIQICTDSDCVLFNLLFDDCCGKSIVGHQAIEQGVR